MAKRGRQPGIKLPEEHRSKIQNSQILNRLIGHAEGRVEMTNTQVQAGLGLLKKALPDLATVQHQGDANKPLTHHHTIEQHIVDPQDRGS